MVENWNNVWYSWNVAKSLALLRNTYSSARTKKMEIRVRKYVGSFEGLEVIELGSGMGSQSLVMALKGAHVTLIDISEEALKLAKELFNRFGLNPTCYRANLFDLNSDLFLKFDISMSFGTVEHFFSDDQRREAITIHNKLLRKGGVSFIGVPNKMCPHHTIFSSLIKVARLSKAPLERPFSAPELNNYAKQAGFSFYETFGSSLLEFDYLMPYFFMPVQLQMTTPLDNYYAAMLTLFAKK